MKQKTKLIGGDAIQTILLAERGLDVVDLGQFQHVRGVVVNIFNGADGSRSQIVRDTFLVPSLLFALFVYWCGLERYLNGLSNPLPMKFILCTSLFISAMYELKRRFISSRYGFSPMTSIIFAVSPWLACEYAIGAEFR